jgi:prolipoprotein diacylglyceryltransferase
MTPAYLPSPPQAVWYLGPVPIRAYALCIIAGIIVAVWLTQRRWEARGGNRDDVLDIATWAVPFGIVGGRLYHVITDPEFYFAPGEQPIRALYIWDGGLGIWGAVALGAVGALIGCRRRGIALADFADAMAPGLVLAQAIGRWGNWFNQELYGAEHTAVGPGDRPGAPPARHPRLHPRPGVDRSPARGPREPFPRRPPQRLDQPGRPAGRGDLPAAAPRAQTGQGRHLPLTRWCRPGRPGRQERPNNRLHIPPPVRCAGAQRHRCDVGTPASTCSTCWPHPR